MAQQKPLMRQLLELFTLHFEQHLPQRQIARSLGVARSTIERTLKRFTAAGLTWPLMSTLTDTELEAALYRRRAHGVAARVQARPNYAAAVLERPCWLDGQARAFRFFGGVPHLIAAYSSWLHLS